MYNTYTDPSRPGVLFALDTTMAEENGWNDKDHYEKLEKEKISFYEVEQSKNGRLVLWQGDFHLSVNGQSLRRLIKIANHLNLIDEKTDLSNIILGLTR